MLVGLTPCHGFSKVPGHTGGFYHLVCRHGVSVHSGVSLKAVIVVLHVIIDVELFSITKGVCFKQVAHKRKGHGHAAYDLFPFSKRTSLSWFVRSLSIWSACKSHKDKNTTSNSC